MNQLMQAEWLPLTTLVSVLCIAGLVGLVRWLVNAKKRSQLLRQLLCPICVGVVATWAWLLVARFLGLEVAPLLLGVLLAGSVVGIVGQLEKYWWLRRGYLVWKVLVIVAGLSGAYMLALENWWGLTAAIVAWLIVTLVFLALSRAGAKQATARTSQAAQLQEQMKNCC